MHIHIFINHFKKRFILSHYVNLTENTLFRFVAEDILYDGDAGSGGSLVEAGVDDFIIEYILDVIFLLTN